MSSINYVSQASSVINIKPIKELVSVTIYKTSVIRHKPISYNSLVLVRVSVIVVKSMHYDGCDTCDSDISK